MLPPPCCAGRHCLLLPYTAAAVQRPKRQPSCAAGWPVPKAGLAGLGRLQRPAEVASVTFYCKLSNYLFFFGVLSDVDFYELFGLFWPLLIQYFHHCDMCSLHILTDDNLWSFLQACLFWKIRSKNWTFKKPL